GREQIDVSPRASLVVSGLFRDSTTLDPRSSAFGAGLGFAPHAHINTWTSWDVVRNDSQTSHVFVNETAVEAVRGVWLKVSPQYRTAPRGFPGLARLVLEANWLPRAHWNADLSYYRDHNRRFDVTAKTLLAQLHLYL